MRVLLVEDHVLTAKSIALLLKKESIVADVTDLGEEALELARLYDYDVVILDLLLPDVNGLVVLRRLRQARIGTPVLVLTGLGGADQRIEGLSSGADDYLSKPFDGRELVARLRALVRRTRGHASNVIRAGELEVDIAGREARLRGRPLPLTRAEFGLLELLAMRKGTAVDKDTFLNHHYGGLDEPDSKIVDVFVCKLRKKLANAGAPGLIRTVWGRGYVLDAAGGGPAAP